LRSIFAIFFVDLLPTNILGPLVPDIISDFTSRTRWRRAAILFFHRLWRHVDPAGFLVERWAIGT